MKILYFFLFLLTIQSYGQQISLYDQFNGNYDYTAIGATLNTEENNDSDAPSSCIINTSASANLNLLPTQNITAAYLYWAGSGTGDLNVTLNGQAITPDRVFTTNLNTLDFFSAFKDVTNLAKIQ